MGIQSLQQWMELNFSQQIDGPALTPKNISGAEIQIRGLARNLRTTFLLDDPNFASHTEQIKEAISLLEKAADVIGRDMSGDVRSQPHKYHI